MMTEKDLALVKKWMSEYHRLAKSCCLGVEDQMVKLRFKLVSWIPELVSELDKRRDAAAGLRLDLAIWSRLDLAPLAEREKEESKTK